jgi:hypothetical protein
VLEKRAVALLCLLASLAFIGMGGIGHANIAPEGIGGYGPSGPADAEERGYADGLVQGATESRPLNCLGVYEEGEAEERLLTTSLPGLSSYRSHAPFLDMRRLRQTRLTLV